MRDRYALLCGMGRAEKIVTFTAPGSGSAKGQGTFVSGINDAGIIGGYTVDANNVSHGFLRSPEGKLECLMLLERGRAQARGPR